MSFHRQALSTTNLPRFTFCMFKKNDTTIFQNKEVELVCVIHH